MNEYFSRRKKEEASERQGQGQEGRRRKREEKREGERGGRKKGGGRERDEPALAGYSFLWQSPAVVITLLFMVTQTTLFGKSLISMIAVDMFSSTEQFGRKIYIIS